MFERFTDRARRAVVCSQEEARQLNHPLIDTEHLLIALARDDVGCSAVALNDAGLDHTNIVEEVQRLHSGQLEVQTSGHLRFTLASRRIFELAFREALDQGHDRIDSGHVLLAMIRFGEGLAITAIENLGGNTAALRKRVIELMPATKQPSVLITLKAEPQEDLDQKRARLRTLMVRKSVTKAKLLQLLNESVDGLPETDLNRALDLLK